MQKPRWSVIKLEGKSEKKNTYEIRDDLEKEFIKSIDKNNPFFWTSIINNCGKIMKVVEGKKSKINSKKSYNKKFQRSNSMQVYIIRSKTRSRSQFKNIK